MLVQYSMAGAPPANFVDLVCNKASLLDEVIIMQTNDNEYQGLVYDPIMKKGTIYVLNRTGNYNATYSLSSYDTTDNSFVVNNEYYVFSNQSVGVSVDLPVYDGVQAYGFAFLVCVLSLAILFKGVLFTCFRKAKNYFF